MNVQSVALLVVLVSTLVACGTAAPTSTPTSIPPALTQPTPIGAASPASVAPLVTATSAPAVATTSEPTQTPAVAIATTRVPTPTVASAAASPTSAPAAPRPATGKVLYTVVRGEETKFHFVFVANADGSNARQILTHAYWPSYSWDGTRLAYYGRPEGGSEGMYLANADGSGAKLIINDATVCCFNWSRDGQWIVYTDSNIKTRPGGPLKMLKMDDFFKTIVELKVDGNAPAFSPDGKQIVYTGNEPGTGVNGLHISPTDGSGAVKNLTRDNGGAPQWSPDGRRIIYHAPIDDQHRQVFVINTDGSGRRRLTNGRGNDIQPVWSRDGNTIFWRSDQNGTAWAIYAMNADGTNPRRIIADAPPDSNLWGWESLDVAP